MIEVLREEIKNMRDKLKAQNIFISMVIHDMRAPSMAIIGISEIISTYF